MAPGLLTFFSILGILILASILNYLFSFLQWYMAVQAGVKITLGQLLQMRRKGYPVNALMDNLIKARQYRIPITIEQLYNHHQKGGDLYNLVDGMVTAKKFGVPLSLKSLQEADLKGVKLAKELESLAERKKSRTG